MANMDQLGKSPMKAMILQTDTFKDNKQWQERPTGRLVFADWMRSFALLGMVFVHAAEQLPQRDENCPQWMRERVDGFQMMFCTFGVPIFFYVSGMAQSRNRRDFFAWIKARLIRMGLPFLVAVFVLLQPMQYLACSTGHYRTFCRRYFPLEGEHTIDYGTFLRNWWGSGLAVVNDLQYLWFLPAMVVVDLLNYAPSKLMLAILEGGFYGKDGCKKFLGQRVDVIAAGVFHVGVFLCASWKWPDIFDFLMLLLVAEVSVCAGLRLFVTTKQYPIWFATCWILPVLTPCMSLYWPMKMVDGRLKEADGTNILRGVFFLLYNLQGQLDQMILPHWEKFEREGGKNFGMYQIVRVLRFNFGLFVFALCSPTSGHDNIISKVPMFLSRPPLAFAGQIGTWLYLKVVAAIISVFYNDEINKRVFLHVTQYPMVVYLFHMPLLVLSFGISDRFPPELSYAYTYFVDTSFALISCCMIYMLLMQTRVSRMIFGLKKDNIQISNTPSVQYKRIPLRPSDSEDI